MPETLAVGGFLVNRKASDGRGLFSMEGTIVEARASVDLIPDEARSLRAEDVAVRTTTAERRLTIYHRASVQVPDRPVVDAVVQPTSVLRLVANVESVAVLTFARGHAT